MRTEIHPFNGFTYEELGGGLVKVHKGDSYGIFDWEGHWKEGNIKHADPHMLGYVGGPTIPGDDSLRANSLPRALQNRPKDDAARIAAERYLGGPEDPTLIPYAKYVGDPGRDTPLGKRSSGISWKEMLEGDTYPERIPDHFYLESPCPGGVTKVPVERYFSQEIHNQEVEKIWKRVWQMACHVDDIPEPGDYIVYDIAHLSYIVVRVDKTTIKAYNNACLHRGRQLREFDGKGATEFRCPFHGWCWETDGSLREIPSEWDFPGVREEAAHLREAKVATWGGWVFINPDPNCGSFEDFIGNLPEHYAKYDYDKRYKATHVAKIVRANWKANQEAFMEGYHILATHPQGMAYGGDGANHQYDVFGNWARAIVYGGSTRSRPHSNIHPPKEEIWERRRAIAAATRDGLRDIIGDRVDIYSDSELIDGQYNNLFPNFHPWGAFSTIIYRFRPYGDDPNMSIHEVMYYRPWPEGEPKPPAAQIHWLGPDDPWTDAPEMGMLGRVLNQDSYNLPKVQAGMKAKVDEYIIFSAYAEGKIRHFHQLWEKWMAAE
jgi:nitrite reductase/ring-hydroxylating ferredoxin subunit